MYVVHNRTQNLQKLNKNVSIPNSKYDFLDMKLLFKFITHVLLKFDFQTSDSPSRTESTCASIEGAVEKITITENLPENLADHGHPSELLAENEEVTSENEDDLGFSESDPVDGIDEDEGSSASDGEDDWITPENLEEAVLKMNDGDHYLEQTKVACLSTDFAIQV